MKTLLVIGLLLFTVGDARAQGYDYVDHGQTQTWIRGVKSHACPANYAMGGINFGGDGNTFTCRYVGFVVEETEMTIPREGMLACPVGYFMRGLNIERNYARCARTWGGVSQASLTAGSDSAAVSECSGSNWAQAAVMVGFHKERRVMLCAGVRR